MNPKFLTESARISDAYSRVCSTVKNSDGKTHTNGIERVVKTVKTPYKTITKEKTTPIKDDDKNKQETPDFIPSDHPEGFEDADFADAIQADDEDYKTKEENVEDNPEYKCFIIVNYGKGWKIDSGWEFKEDAIDRTKEQEIPRTPKCQVKIVGRRTLTKFNLDAANDNDWMKGMPDGDSIYGKKLITEKGVDESEEGEIAVSDAVDHSLKDDSNPAVYIGTYGNYNRGSLNGEGKASGWVDLTTFADADDFNAWLNEQSGGKDVEWMFQDYMNFPSSLYGESNIDEVFDYLKLIDDSDFSEQEIDALIENSYSVSDIKSKIDSGDIYVHHGCKDMSDVAYKMLEENGKEAFKEDMYRNAFDYEELGREIDMDWDGTDYEGKTAYEEFGVDEDDDTALGEAYVDQIYGGIGNVPDEELMSHIDYDYIGNELEYDGTWIETGDSMIEVR